MSSEGFLPEPTRHTNFLTCRHMSMTLVPILYPPYCLFRKNLYSQVIRVSLFTNDLSFPLVSISVSLYGCMSVRTCVYVRVRVWVCMLGRTCVCTCVFLHSLFEKPFPSSFTLLMECGAGGVIE